MFPDGLKSKKIGEITCLSTALILALNFVLFAYDGYIIAVLGTLFALSSVYWSF